MILSIFGKVKELGTATIAGDIITVSGSIEVRGPYSEALIHVIDPEGKTVELVYVRVTASQRVHSVHAQLCSR